MWRGIQLPELHRPSEIAQTLMRCVFKIRRHGLFGIQVMIGEDL